ncbi:hypothetical protein NYJ85_10575, partial [Helicobacter sp. CPD2-1]|nr:hypothetical protein [Helicobacter sp. CPD2-1]
PMLFNSYLFIFCFLPIVWAIFHLLKALSITQNSSVYMTLAKGFLVLASLFFYAYWKLIYLPILLGSMLVNYGVVRGILRGRNGGGGQKIQLRVVIAAILWILGQPQTTSLALP